MIKKEMVGRLGNQMFQYAAMRAIQELNGNEDDMVISFDKYVKKRGFKNELEMFRTREFKQANKIKMNKRQEFIIFLIKCFERILRKISSEEKFELYQYRFEKKIAPFLNKMGIYFMRQGYYPLKKTNSKDKIVIGYFESAKYFNHIREKILEEFTPKYEKIDKNLDLYSQIENSESVCITIRRGDFITDENARKNHYICTPEYFYKAISLMQERNKNARFFVFSDDIEWVKTNMKFPENTMFESGNDPVWEKLRLMYSCKHFIISNSTFSWWAQYLSRNEEKIVIAPNRWRNLGYSKDVYDEKWILIEV